MFDSIPSPILLGILQLIFYLIIAVNMRAVAHVRYPWIAATDIAICGLNFTLVPMIAKAEGWGDMAGYAVGGTIGALAGVWLSEHWRSPDVRE